MQVLSRESLIELLVLKDELINEQALLIMSLEFKNLIPWYKKVYYKIIRFLWLKI